MLSRHHLHLGGGEHKHKTNIFRFSLPEHNTQAATSAFFLAYASLAWHKNEGHRMSLGGARLRDVQSLFRLQTYILPMGDTEGEMEKGIKPPTGKHKRWRIESKQSVQQRKGRTNFCTRQP